jgi:cytochrome c biogenesis protein CcmG/thiol:disulfide interchange protein DsbE
MRARLTGVRPRPAVLTAAGMASLALLLAACGSPATSSKAAGGGSQDQAAAAASAAPAGTAAPGAVGASAAAKAGRSAAPRTSAQPGAASSSGPSTGGGTTHAATGASPAAASGQSVKALRVDTKCRKPAGSVGTGVAVKGQKPPGFTGTTLDCGSLDFGSYTQGKPTLVNFFASWCEPCHNEAKDLEAVYQEFHDTKGFQVVGIETQDESGSPSWFYDKAHWTFPAVWDDKEKIEHAWNQASGAISTLPASFWIHPDGTISAIDIGQMSRSQMEDEFNKL